MKGRAAIGVALAAATLAGCSGGGGGSATGSTAASAGNLTTPAVPAGWKPVTANGVTVDVPSDWPVMRWKPTCGVSTPTVYTGPQGQAPQCTTIAPAAEVDIGAYPHPVGRVKGTLNGMHTYVFKQSTPYAGPPSGNLTEEWLQLVGPPVTLGLYFRVPDTTALPGGGPDMLQKIVSTVHPAS